MTIHRRSCRTCGWSGEYDSAARAAYCKRKHRCSKWIARAEAKARSEARRAMVDRTPKPCRHKVADHQHGTHAAYVLDRCRCHHCTKANAAYENNRARQKAYGRWNGLVDAQPARAHVQQLMDQGMGLKRIVAVSGISQGLLWKLVYGKRRPDGTQVRSKRIRSATEQRLLAVQVDLAAGARVDATGTHRRVQALVAIGWSQQRIADGLGLQRSNFGTMMRADAITRRTRDAMVALYDEWSMRLPPQTSHREKVSVSRARNHAKAHRWAPPLAWDDDALDDPNAHPQTRVDVDDLELDESAVLRRMAGDQSVRLTKQEKAEVVHRLRGQGISDADIERRTGISQVRRYVPRQRDLEVVPA